MRFLLHASLWGHPTIKAVRMMGSGIAVSSEVLPDAIDAIDDTAALIQQMVSRASSWATLSRCAPSMPPRSISCSAPLLCLGARHCHPSRTCFERDANLSATQRCSTSLRPDFIRSIVSTSTSK